MIGFTRSVPAVLLALVAPLLHAQESPKALPVTAPAPPPPLAVPAVVDVVTFNYRTEGEQHHLAITSTPTRLRVDELDDGYSIIYDPETEFYTGLENRNYTYWEFSWPQVKTAVQSSQRGEARLRELGAEGFNGDSSDTNPAPADSATASPTDTNSPDATSSASVGSDTSGYIWQPATDHKRIGGFDCVRWVGHSLSAPDVNAWCYAGALPKVQTALTAVRAINEPVALVPVRTLVPTFVYEVYDDLVKGGVTPLAIDWGDEHDKSYFDLISIKSREGKTTLFTVPKLYIKTTLVTMDGMLAPVKDQEKQSPQAHHEKGDKSILPMP
jgi:hypothetical protein